MEPEIVYSQTPAQRAAQARATKAWMTTSRLQAAKVPPKLKRALEIVRAGIELGLVTPKDLEGEIVQLDDEWWADRA